MKHSSGLCLVDSRVSSFWETTRAVTRNEKIWNCHLYLRSLCKSFYQILEITMLLELHKSPSLQKTALMQSRRKTQHLSLEHQAFSLFSSTRDEENWLDRESKSTDSNFTYHPPRASKNKKGTIRERRKYFWYPKLISFNRNSPWSTQQSQNMCFYHSGTCSGRKWNLAIKQQWSKCNYIGSLLRVIISRGSASNLKQERGFSF